MKEMVGVPEMFGTALSGAMPIQFCNATIFKNIFRIVK